MKFLMRCHRVGSQLQRGNILNLRSGYFLGVHGNNYSESAKSDVAAASGKNEDAVHRAPVLKHRPSNFDKRLLVWTKKYKSIDDVPETVSRETMEQAKSKTRIKVNIYMMALTAVICIVMINWGRRDAKKGESVHKMNLEWHKNYNKESSEK